MHSPNTASKSITYTAFSIALLTVCSWIAVPIPGAVAFTLQSFSVMLIAGLLPLRLSCTSYLLYLLLGILGLPVFAGFANGGAVFFGLSGGFLIGFFFAVLLIGISTRLWGQRLYTLLPTLLLCIPLYHLFGILYFAMQAKVSWISAFMLCSLPYLLIDVLKALLAAFLIRKLSKLPIFANS